MFDDRDTGMPNQTWVGLSDKGLITLGHLTALQQGFFVMEFRAPKGKVILNLQCQDGTARSFSVFMDPEIGIAILHRKGAQLARHMIAGPLPAVDGTARLCFRFDIPANEWLMSFEILDQPNSRRTAQGVAPLSMDATDVQLICATPQRDQSLLWFGFCRGDQMPQSGAWIGPQTLVPTSLGPVAAANLRPGDILLTEDHGPMMLRAVRGVDLPARGSFAPVLLRAPFFGNSRDLLVSADQQMVIASGEVEYLFGTDAVLVTAREVVDGRTALADDRRAVTKGVCLDLGCAALLDLGGVLMAVGQEHGFQDFPILKRFEVATLMAMLRHQVTRVA